MKNQQLIIAVAIVGIVFGAAGFFAGMKYQQSQRPAGRLGNFQMGLSGTRQNGFRPVAGEIISIDEKSITVKLSDGSSKIVLIGDKTSINKATEGTKSDLTVGTRVAVFGTENTGGTVTAQSVQINPVGRGAFGTPQPLLDGNKE